MHIQACSVSILKHGREIDDFLKRERERWEEKTGIKFGVQEGTPSSNKRQTHEEFVRQVIIHEVIMHHHF
jgi:hypothetical protein